MQNEIKRDIYLTLRVTQDEKEYITKKAKLAESSSRAAYIRKMAITGVI